MKKNLRIKNHQIIRKNLRLNLWQQFLKNKLPKESINTQKVTNATNLIIQSEPPAPKLIMVDKKIRSDASFLSIGTGASVTQ